jgi:hypothetical protein
MPVTDHVDYPINTGTTTITKPIVDSPQGNGQPIQDLVVRGDGQTRSIVNVKIGSSSSKPYANAAHVLANRFRPGEFSKYRLNSDDVKQIAFWMFCQTAADPAYLPEFGGGYQSSGWWHDLHLGGTQWKAGWQWDGGVHANLNSENILERIQTSNGASFADGVFVIGTPEGNLQQDQFLNFAFRAIKAEHKAGHILVVNHGGAIIWDGGGASCIIGVGDNKDLGRGGTAFVLGNEASSDAHRSVYDNVRSFRATGVRFEARVKRAMLFSTTWRGNNSVIVLDSCSVATDTSYGYVKGATHDYKLGRIVCPDGKMPNIVIRDSIRLPGYIEYVGPIAVSGGVTVENCNLVDGTRDLGRATSFVRAAPGSGIPRVTYR